MAKHYFTHKAIKDISGIWDYTVDTWSEKQADKYYNSLIESCTDFTKNPKLGKKYFQIHSELYGFNVHKHIIFYRIDSNSDIEITRILHESMDLKDKF